MMKEDLQIWAGILAAAWLFCMFAAVLVQGWLRTVFLIVGFAAIIVVLVMGLRHGDCPYCGKPLGRSWKVDYCPHCGKKLI